MAVEKLPSVRLAPRGHPFGPLHPGVLEALVVLSRQDLCPLLVQNCCVVAWTAFVICFFISGAKELLSPEDLTARGFRF